jgi:hypothetical protein
VVLGSHVIEICGVKYPYFYQISCPHLVLFDLPFWKVVNDGDMYMWRELGVNSWPTFVVIGPNGKVLAQISGEGHRKVLMHIS